MKYKLITSKVVPDFPESPAEVLLSRTGGKFYLYQSESIFKRNAIVQFAKADKDFSFAFIDSEMKIKAIFFDMDATVIKEESIVELSRYAGTEEKVELITEKAMAGELSFEEALNERVGTLEGLSDDIFEKVFPKLTLQPGAEELIKSFKDLSIPSFLVSGGFTQLAFPLIEKIGILEARANVLEVVNEKLTGKVKGQIIGAEEKKIFLEEMAKKHNFAPEETVAVGDGANDLKMLEKSRISVGFLPKDILIEHVDVLNRTGSHLFLLDILEVVSLV